MSGIRLEHLEHIQDRITEGLNQGFGKITDRIDAYTIEAHSIFSRNDSNSFIKHLVVYSGGDCDCTGNNPCYLETSKSY